MIQFQKFDINIYALSSLIRKGLKMDFFLKEKKKNLRGCKFMIITWLFFFLLAVIMKQTYFKEPKYSKNYIIQKSKNLYEEYVNAFTFYEMINTKNEVSNKKELQERAQNSWQEVKMRSKDFIQNQLLQTPIQPV